MRQLLAVVAIVAVVVITAASYASGRWIGSLVEVGFDDTPPLLADGAADEGVQRARAQAEEEAARAAAESRARDEAARRLEVQEVAIPDPHAGGADAALANVRCAGWATMTVDEQLHAVEVLVARVLEQVRIEEQLSEDAERSTILAGARVSLDKVCQGSSGERELVEIARALYGGGE